ncbi:hypothetical protein Tco_1114454 [Tanacetum coccineum]|uniref:Reverse transcriptase Ty1/copia-type domain-containing protein n=1 Tax=Tanacetum coccineum TaxID=301880 RepID=A0ABQ5IW65_9ASTR
MRIASTPMETSKPLLKDVEAEDVNVHLYRSTIGSLMYLTASRPDIMFTVYACARFQVTPIVSHLHAVKRIFKYLKGQPKLGLWYPKDSPFDLEAYSDSDYAGASLDRLMIGMGWTYYLDKIGVTIEDTIAEDLIFADSHNMVAYLEISEDNADFAEIVDFLNASPIRRDLHFNDEDGITCLTNTEIFENLQLMGSKSTTWNEFGTNIASTVICLAKKQKFNFSKLIFDEPIPIVASSSQPKKTHKHRKTKRKAIKISQSSGPTNLVADETVHEERGDNVERVATTGTILDEEQGSGDRPAQSMKLQELMDLCTKLSDRVLDLENVRIESSAEKSLGDQEDSSKQGRNEIDQDEGISWFQENSETQGRYGHDIGVNNASTSITTTSINITNTELVTTASAPVTTAGVSISTSEPSTPPITTTTTPIEDEDLTIAQTLMKMKSEKSKAKGVTMQEPSESGTRKKKDQIKYDVDVAQRLQSELDEEARLEREREEEASKAVNIAKWDDVQAMMDTDYV